MDKIFVCLAVSYKYGGRCISGVELVKDNNGTYSIVGEKGNPKWIRPITRNTVHGEISTEVSSMCNIFDIICIRNVVPCPDCAQNENYFFEKIQNVGKIRCTISALDLLCDKQHALVFGNRGKAVHPDTYNELGYSLMLVKPERVNFFMEPRPNSIQERLRIEFTYHGNSYDLPVTDPVFCKKAELGVESLNRYKDYYLTLSLGVEYEGWHSKLVANVIALQ